jgi:hypothetical protein
MPFSMVDESVVVRVGITSHPLFLTLFEEKRGEIEAAGKALVKDDTVRWIPKLRDMCPQWVSQCPAADVCFTSQAGSSIFSLFPEQALV